jgi:hypothetical protein
MFRFQAIQHEVDHSQSDASFRRCGASLEVDAEPTTLVEPSEGSLNRPADRPGDPPFHILRVPDDRPFPIDMIIRPLIKLEILIRAIHVHVHNFADRLPVQLRKLRG